MAVYLRLNPFCCCENDFIKFLHNQECKTGDILTMKRFQACLNGVAIDILPSACNLGTSEADQVTTPTQRLKLAAPALNIQCLPSYLRLSCGLSLTFAKFPIVQWEAWTRRNRGCRNPATKRSYRT